MSTYKKSLRGRGQNRSASNRDSPGLGSFEWARSNAWANPEREDTLQQARIKGREKLIADMYKQIDPRSMEVGYFHLSENEYRPLGLSGDCAKWFQEVQDQYHVQLSQHNTDLNIIQVRSNSSINIKRALSTMSVLYAKESYLESSENTTLLCRILCAKTPESKKITFIASQHQKESRARLNEEADDIISITDSEHKVSLFAKKLAPILQAQILKVAYMPRAVSFSMDIGLLKFSTVPAGSSLTVQQFERLLETRGSRLKPSLDTRLGPALYHDKLLQVVDDFYQATTRRLFHGGLPPKTYDEEISMQTKDGKRIIIGIMSTRESGVILPSRIWKTDAPRKLESIRVACPDQRLDYEFVLETNDSGKADAQYSKLLKEIQVTGVPTHAETPYLIRFPKPNSCPDEITGTEIRTTNRFPFRDTYYQIEVSVVRRWSGMGTEGSFNESTEVSFTCMDWYTKLGNWSDSDVQDPRKADMCELFLHKPTYEESLSQYLDYATEVQRLLEKAKDMGS